MDRSLSCISPYDTIRLTILTCAQKLTSSQLNLPHGTKQKRIMKKLKTKKRRCSEETETGRKSMMGTICEEVGLEAGVKETGSYGW